MTLWFACWQFLAKCRERKFPVDRGKISSTEISQKVSAILVRVATKPIELLLLVIIKGAMIYFFESLKACAESSPHLAEKNRLSSEQRVVKIPVQKETAKFGRPKPTCDVVSLEIKNKFSLIESQAMYCDFRSLQVAESFSNNSQQFSTLFCHF